MEEQLHFTEFIKNPFPSIRLRFRAMLSDASRETASDNARYTNREESFMRTATLIILSLGMLLLLTVRTQAQEYLTKEGQLTQTLKISQKQGGFAGFTGFQYTIGPDGTWTSESIFNKKLTPKANGKLSAKDLAKIAAILEKNEFGKLPAKSGVQPGANPHILTFEYGKQTAILVGQSAPKLDTNNPAASVDSRFAGIWEGVVGLLMAAPKSIEEK
jgi:hypothetical protein